MTPPLARKLRSALRLDGADRRLLAEAAAALLAARLRSGLLPFRALARQLGGLLPPTAAVDPRPLSTDEAAAVRKIRWSIEAAAPWLPFRTVCLQQAIAARAMLARRGIASVLHLGVGGHGEPSLNAHAWLDAGDLKVTGYPLDPGLVEAGRFVDGTRA